MCNWFGLHPISFFMFFESVFLISKLVDHLVQVIFFLMVNFKDSFFLSTMPENLVGLFVLRSCIFRNNCPIFIKFVLKCTEQKALSDGGYIFFFNYYFREEPGFGMLRHILSYWCSLVYYYLIN